MTINTVITLKDVLSNADQLPWDYALYMLEEASDWLESIPCMVLNPDDVEDDMEDPLLAIENKMKYVLEMASVQDVLSNAKTQSNRDELNIETMLAALKHYYEHDAFMII